MPLLRCRCSSRVSLETISTDMRLRTPYRGIAETGRPTLRIRIGTAGPGHAPIEVVIDVDDLAVEVREGDAALVLGAGAIDALFVVERQPRIGFLTWFGVFARHKGSTDRLVLETPEKRVARFVERQIETWLGLDDLRVRGEVPID